MTKTQEDINTVLEIFFIKFTVCVDYILFFRNILKRVLAISFDSFISYGSKPEMGHLRPLGVGIANAYFNRRELIITFIVQC